jgi:YD repeat-containing protein
VNGDGYADVVVGAYRYDGDGANKGWASVYYGNAGDGLHLLPRQMRTDGSAPIAPLGLSDSLTGVQLRLIGRMPLGREKVKLQWQVAPLGTPITATTGIISGTSGTWIDTGTGGSVITQTVTGLESATPYHWRARLLYRPGNRLGQAASRWLHMPWNGWNEQDFRTPLVPATVVTQVISYDYDPLYRLISATYSSGEVYTYTYDAANRLTWVNNVGYTWDDNPTPRCCGDCVVTCWTTACGATPTITPTGWCRW